MTRRILLLILVALSLPLALQGQTKINPVTGINWPGGCSALNQVYSLYTQGCITVSNAGLMGLPTTGGTMTGQIAFSGTGVAANTLQNLGGAALSGAAFTGPVTMAGLLTAGLQPLRPIALSRTRTKEAAMALFNANLSVTSAQEYFISDGDSTGLFHSWSFSCSEVAAYGQAGWIGSAPAEANNDYGEYCPYGLTGIMTLAGGTSAVTGDYTHFPNGLGWSVPASGTLTSTYAFTSTRQIAFYTADSAANVTVSVSSNGGSTWTALSSCNGIAVTTGVGNVCDQTLGSELNYQIRLTVNSGTVYVWNLGQVDLNIAGVVGMGINVGGQSLPDHASTPTAISQPYYNDIDPDLVTMEWKYNGVTQGSGSCSQATTAAPTVFQPWSYWFDSIVGQYQSAQPLADFILFGSYQTGAGNEQTCIAAANTVEQQWAAVQNPLETYVDNYNMLTNAQMQTNGWIDTSVHETTNGQAAQGDLDTEYLGILNRTTAPQVKNAVAAYGHFNALLGPPLTQQVTGQSLGAYVRGNTSSALYPSWSFKGDPFGDLIETVIRAHMFYNPAGLEWGFLADPTGSAGGNYNFLPPFQLSDLSATNNSGQWLAAPSGHAGIYSNLGAGTLATWYVATQSPGDNSNKSASTAYVATAITLTTGTPTVGQAACIYAAGPPVVIGKCTSVVGAGGACTCAP